MGINNLYKEIGSGERTALSKLALEHYEKHGRPFRLAVDISIWNFQNQAASGGKNPELRTLYYRLLRLLSLSIQPLFVFDGPNKPPFKRGVRTNSNSAAASAYFAQHTKQLLGLFGFPIHLAPGEAEAECALIQRNGIVDAVLSEDVDTLMFGCTLHLRNWSSTSTKGKTPTHVELFTADNIHSKSGLDREGMILIAMMSGGDYLPGGIERCGPKTASEAARGGFGAELCKLSCNDNEGIRQWRNRLRHELATNEDGHFNRSHKGLKIPENFPDKVVLSYYTHPATSSAEELEQLARRIDWNQEINVAQLRLFVAEMFEWVNLTGAMKFIRGLAPAMLVRKLRERAGMSNGDLALQELEEKRLVKMICGSRQHFDTDATPELRIGFIPTDIINLDLEEERDLGEVKDIEASADSSTDEHTSESSQQVTRSPKKPRAPSRYNPSELQRIWLLETYVKLGVGRVGTPRKPKAKVTDAGMKRGALDAFTKYAKPGVSRLAVKDGFESTFQKPATKASDNKPAHPLDEKALAQSTASDNRITSQKTVDGGKSRKKPASKITVIGASTKSHSKAGTSSSVDNPWTKAKRPVDTLNVKLPPGTRYSALGICVAEDTDETGELECDRSDNELAESFTGVLDNTLVTSKKHARPISNSSVEEMVRIRSQRKPGLDITAAALPQGVVDLTTSTTESNGPTKPAQSLGGKNQSPHESPCKILILHKPVCSNNCGIPIPEHKSPSSDSESLPSPSLLFCVKATQSSGKSTQSTQASSTNHPRSSLSPSTTKRARKPKGFVMVRESLEGAWRDIEPWEAEEKPTKAIAGVEVIDLT
ncbi:hypothetical protein G7Y79_00074g098730 [Physcia stellaris]|nr:hypothetical protein G7Y79_00074g098730 [Physcia stellaris]